MRALTNNERRLLLLLGLAFFLVLNVFGFTALAKKMQALNREKAQLVLEQNDAKGWLTRKDLWNKRKEWLTEKQPRSDSSGQDSARLLESLQQGARQQKINITQQRLMEPRSNPDYMEVAVQLEARGALESMLRWVAEIQAPDRFQAITSLTLKSDTEPPKVICNLTIARWYAHKP